jgi:hypothetical protein
MNITHIPSEPPYYMQGKSIMDVLLSLSTHEEQKKARRHKEKMDVRAHALMQANFGLETSKFTQRMGEFEKTHALAKDVAETDKERVKVSGRFADAQQMSANTAYTRADIERDKWATSKEYIRIANRLKAQGDKIKAAENQRLGDAVARMSPEEFLKYKTASEQLEAFRGQFYNMRSQVDKLGTMNELLNMQLKDAELSAAQVAAMHGEELKIVQSVANVAPDKATEAINILRIGRETGDFETAQAEINALMADVRTREISDKGKEKATGKAPALTKTHELAMYDAVSLAQIRAAADAGAPAPDTVTVEVYDELGLLDWKRHPSEGKIFTLDRARQVGIEGRTRISESEDDTIKKGGILSPEDVKSTGSMRDKVRGEVGKMGKGSESKLDKITKNYSFIDSNAPIPGHVVERMYPKLAKILARPNISQAEIDFIMKAISRGQKEKLVIAAYKESGGSV